MRIFALIVLSAIIAYASAASPGAVTFRFAESQKLSITPPASTDGAAAASAVPILIDPCLVRPMGDFACLAKCLLEKAISGQCNGITCECIFPGIPLKPPTGTDAIEM